MVKVSSKALNQTIETGRIIGNVKGAQPGPSLVFTGGIHGNEPAGVFALQKVLQEIEEMHIPFQGNCYAISGNLWALERAKRFQKEDLNRLWTTERMEKLMAGKLEVNHEDTAQQIEIFQSIRNITETEKGPFYFIDLHTTSSNTVPFLTVNDSLLNRKFTTQYPIPMILGIEEYLEGPLLSYLNELGYVSFGYEGGQHDALSSIESMKCFIYLTMVFVGSIDQEAIDFEYYYEQLSKNTDSSQRIYEIFSRYEIKEGEDFRMKSGFSNFQKVEKGEVLAKSNGKAILAERKAEIFMPLYQSQGNDGFFLIRKIPSLFLRLSALVRQIRIDRMLVWLPGINWLTDKHDILSVNQKVARFFAKQFFHLLGYRSKRVDNHYLIMKNREDSSRTGEYLQARWYKH